MSKLYNTYLKLKQNDSDTLYLFRTGIFYSFLDNDAKFINNILGLKLVKLNDEILKCSFPTNALDKYIRLLNSNNLTYKIIDDNLSKIYTVDEYKIDIEIKNILRKISAVDTDNISIREAYSLLENLKEDVEKIRLEI